MLAAGGTASTNLTRLDTARDIPTPHFASSPPVGPGSSPSPPQGFPPAGPVRTPLGATMPGYAWRIPLEHAPVRHQENPPRRTPEVVGGRRVQGRSMASPFARPAPVRT